MEINYIILVHKNPEQVQRLIDSLNTPTSYFYIHIDKGIDITPFLATISNKKNIFFISNKLRQYGTWGDIGIVKATLNALSQIMEDNRTGYCVLMSGQDYPLRNNDSIAIFFKTNYGVNFIETFPIPSIKWGEDGGLNRLNQYKINLSTERLDFVQLPSFLEKKFYKKQTLHKLLKIARKKNFTVLLKLLKKRKLLNPLTPYGGSQWWALPIETIEEILKFIASNPKYINYHKDTLLPDEIFFHSILMHLKETNDVLVVKPSITYVNWTRKNTSLPVTFNKKDIEELKEASQNYLFARKFDIKKNDPLLDQIDKELLN